MSVIYKLAISLFALSLAVFGIYGAYQIRSESQDLRATVEQETRLLANSLLVSVENALRDNQTEDVQKLMQQLERIKPSVDVRIYFQNRSVIRSDAESLPWPEKVEDALYQAARDGEMNQFYYPAEEPYLFIFSMPFNEASSTLRGNVAVVKSLQTMNEDLSKTQNYILLSFITFILFTSLLCFFLGHVYISVPLRKLRQAMRPFRNGTEPPKPLPVTGKDELSSVTQEFNRMTAELFSAYRQLDVETQHRRQLQRALQDADKLITIGQLSAGLAHEIGSPLQILKGRGEHLLLCTDQPGEVIRHARILASQTERITRIVQQLLEFTRRRPPYFTRIDLCEPVNAVLNLLEYEAHKKQVELSYEAVKDLPLIVADSDGIQQIVLNLITNALSATGAGGRIVVAVEPCQTGTDPAHSEAVEAVHLIVRDNGCGMSQEILEHLFDPFFTTRHEQGGVGLGLAVARSIVTAHHGSIKAESSPGLGSTITIILPVEKLHHDVD